MSGSKGEWLRSVREKCGLTVKAVSEELGAPYKTVQAWNDGTRTPPEWLQRLIVEKLERTMKG